MIDLYDNRSEHRAAMIKEAQRLEKLHWYRNAIAQKLDVHPTLIGKWLGGKAGRKTYKRHVKIV